MPMNYVFGDFTVDPRRRLLARRSGEAVTIGDKAFDALLYLVRHPGQIISRATLAGALWPNADAVGNNLSQVIKALRFALGDARPPHRYVATVQRRGYQFVAADVLTCAAPERPGPEEPQVTAQADTQGPSRSESQRHVPRSAFVWRAGVFPLVVVACAITMVLIVSSLLAPPGISSSAMPDRVVPAPASAWPLPPLVACEQEPPGMMSTRCEALRAAANERVRRWRRGMQRT